MRTVVDAIDRPPLQELLAGAHSGILLVGITPPRRSASQDQIGQIAKVTMARLAPLHLDGLILYDIDDESDRNPDERPFPYLPTMDPAAFHAEHLHDWPHPVVIYRCVGKYPEADLRTWMLSADIDRVVSIFVGASSGQKAVQTELSQAYALRQQVRPDLLLGGVCITERYTRGAEEHLRMLAKLSQGCTFFISQVVYNVDATKSMLSDYYYACADRRVAPRPVILTLSVCGSLKTLSFLQWLGVDVPRWLENTLRHATDPLAVSYEQCVSNAGELITFCRRLGVPFGFNVESVSNRKVEIDASVALAARLRGMLDRR
jgi:hypothetical protein